jgi:DUF1365 family protein
MAKIDNFSLCLAKVWHKRLKPSINSFSYRVFYLCFDVAKIAEIRSKFLSLNRFNLFSFYEKDHGKRDGSGLEVWIRKILAQHDLNDSTKRIFLFAHPRVLGYVFNPVSFWFCLDAKENLIAVLCEVNNTFGENHNYLVFNRNHSPIQPNQWLEAEKEFHVSPFFEVRGSYKFRFIFNEKQVAAWIDYLLEDQQKNLLTSVICRQVKPSNSKLLLQFFTIPLMTLKVVFLIHYQALKLVLKKNKYIAKPKQKSIQLTLIK